MPCPPCTAVGRQSRCDHGGLGPTPEIPLGLSPQMGTWKGSAALQRWCKVVAPPEDTKYSMPGPSPVLQDQGLSTSFIHELPCQEQMRRMKGTRETARDRNARKKGPKQQTQTLGAHSSISGRWGVCLGSEGDIGFEGSNRIMFRHPAVPPRHALPSSVVTPCPRAARPEPLAAATNQCRTIPKGQT